MNKPLIAAAAVLAALAAPRLAADAADTWSHNCASCHGADGAGKTKAGRMASVKDFTDAKYQGSFTDEQAAAQIKNGFKDKDTGKEKMKAFGEKLSDADIQDLVKYVRAFKK
jgi:mono/diheme cytochrome c family protein